MMRKFTIRLGLFAGICTVMLVLIFQTAMAQGTRVSGRVTDVNEGAPIPGVNILIKGSSAGTTTDAEGRYSLSVEDPNAVLVFSFIGYSSKEFPLRGVTVLDVVLEPDVTTLQELVIVGYGTQIGKELTGSVQQVKTEALKDLPVAQLTQKLQGRLAGVQISQNTGKPGQGMAVRIRGQASILAGSDPLYVVDGFPIVGNINNINPMRLKVSPC